jgi:hypothetical protein
MIKEQNLLNEILLEKISFTKEEIEELFGRNFWGDEANIEVCKGSTSDDAENPNEE